MCFEHQAIQPNWPVQHVRAGIAGLDAEQLQVITAEDSEMVAGTQCMMSSWREHEV